MKWFLAALLSGLINGSFPVPMKKVRNWKWEHIWAAWSVWALVILPWLAAWVTVPDLLGVLSTSPEGSVLKTFLVGCAWGVGAITFGMGVDYLGVGLGLATIMGLNTTLGVLIPLCMKGMGAFFTAAGGLIVVGVAIMLAGTVVCGRAGKAKEVALHGSTQDQKGREKPFMTGLIICIIAGVCGALINIGFVIGKPIQDHAVTQGVDALWSSNAVWCVMLSGAFFVNTGFCLYKVHQGGTWSLFSNQTVWNELMSLIMGILWFGGILLFGVSSTMLGKLGASVGFAAFIGMGITAGNLWGILTGEWSGLARPHLKTMMSGVGLLLLGLVVIGFANSLAS